MSVKVHVRVPVGLPIPQVADFIAGCEAAGFAGVGIHDHQHAGRDVFLTLAMAAQKTRHLELYPMTTNPITRHPGVLASVAHSLEEIAPGRMSLTIGPGFLAVLNIGHPKATLKTMREAVIAIRALLRGGRVTFNGQETKLRNVSATPTPIYITASGPKMMELAGELADGAFVMVGLHPRSVAAARKRLETGAQRSGRSLEGFRTVHIVPVTVGPDGAAAREWPRQWFQPGQPYLKYPNATNLVWLREAGIDLPEDFVPESLDAAQAAEICDAFGLFGTPQECLARLKRARTESGVQEVFLFPTHTREGGYAMPQEVVDAFGKVVLPGLRG